MVMTSINSGATADVKGATMRRFSLAITTRIQAALAELEWQFCRLNCWLRDDE